MKKRYVILPLFFAVLLLAASSLAFEVGVRGIYWFPTLDGRVGTSGPSAFEGARADLDSAFGINDENYPGVEVFIGSDRHHLSLSFMDIDYSGSNIPSEYFVFGDLVNFPYSDLIKSSVQFQMFDLCYQYDFLDLENVLAGFSLGGIIQVKYVDGDVRVRGTLTNPGLELFPQDVRETFKVPIPMLGLNIHVGILADILEARVRGTGMTYSGNTIYDVSGEISVTPLPFVDIHGGYKILYLDIDQDDVLLEADMSGPYIGLTISF